MQSDEAWDTYYHGTAGTYSRIGPGQGILGVGLYLTDNPEKAAFYAETHAQQASRKRTGSNDHAVGQNVRIFRVPESLKLLNLFSPEGWREYVELIHAGARSRLDQGYPKLFEQRNLAIDPSRVDEAGVKDAMRSGFQLVLQDILVSRGYDGIRLDDTIGGQFYHAQLMIFPESIRKVRDASEERQDGRTAQRR